MKKTMFCMLCIIFLILSGCSTRYKRISFHGGEALGDSHPKNIDEKTEVFVTSTEVFAKKIPIYEISPRMITKEEIQQLRDNLDLNDLGPHQFVNYHGNSVDVMLASCVDPSRGYFNMTDEELEKAAWEAFKKLPFMEGEYKYLGITSRAYISNSTGTHLDEVGVSFRRHLDDARILGDDECLLEFDGSGLRTISVELYDYKKTGTMDVIPVEDAVANIKCPDRFVASLKDETQISSIYSTMQVEEIVPILMNQYSDGCTILQPLYSFVGTATDEKGVESKFNSWVIAIPESYTHD